jgi:hypothetical protein
MARTPLQQLTLSPVPIVALLVMLDLTVPFSQQGLLLLAAAFPTEDVVRNREGIGLGVARRWRRGVVARKDRLD